MVPSDLDRDEIRHLTAATGAAPRGGGREGCDFVNDRAAAASAAFAAPQDARREQTQHDGAGPASRVAAETASAADVEQWLRALEEVSGAADGDISGAALAPGLQIPFDLLQQSADAALFAQLQMLSSPPFDAAPALDLHDTVALIGMRGADVSGALLIGSRTSQPAVWSPRTSSLSQAQAGARSPRAGVGETETPGDARGSGDGSAQALESPRKGASGAGGATAAAGAVRAPGVEAQAMSEGRGGAGPATSVALSGGAAGLSGGLSAEDDWRPRSRTRFDAEAMRKGEIKPRSMKERRRRDKISEGLRQLRQAIPESLLGAQQDMGAMIEAAVLHISNLQARVSKLERGAAIEEIVDRMQP
ncbi:unnamed protein product [Closterium sp. Naga37s-1]|nr:unnamed protein product [Closterium sp. Naga37s-1]